MCPPHNKFRELCTWTDLCVPVYDYTVCSFKSNIKEWTKSDADPPADINCKQIFCAKYIYVCYNGGSEENASYCLLLHLSQTIEIPKPLDYSFLLLLLIWWHIAIGTLERISLHLKS